MKIFFIITVSIFFLAVGIEAAQACSIAAPQVVIELPLNQEMFSQDNQCLDTTCVYSFKKNEYGEWWVVRSVDDVNLAYVIYLNAGTISMDLTTLRDNPNLIDDLTFFLAIDALVKGDITPLREAFWQNVREWQRGASDFILAGDLNLQQYDANLATELVTEAEQKLGQCNYSEVAAYNGEWMFMRDVVRPYCQVVGGVGASCPVVTLDHREFIKSNINNLSVITIPYLMKYLIAAAVVVWGLFALGRWILTRKKNDEKTTKKKK